MFGSFAEKRIVREVDKIVSMKEDVDTLSWSRVLEIGRQLQAECQDDQRLEYARELIGIAQSNISLSARLGVDPSPHEDHVMASGVEILEGGMAETALLEQRAQAAEDEKLGEEADVNLVSTAGHQPEAAAELELDTEPESEPEPTPEPEPESAPEPTPESEPESTPEPELHARRGSFARFRNLYESRDGGLCVFEDAHGHLVAVDASKLA